MAAIYPSYGPIPSTPSASSQSSLPPSYCISVHDHILPPGWQCKYDPKTNKYYFINDYITNPWDFWKVSQPVGSCQSSRSSSPSHTYTSIGKYFQPFSQRYKANDSTVQRIAKMFPDVDENYIAQLLRKHANREHIVMNALRNESLVKTYQVQPDEALFYKLKAKFPGVDPDNIRQFLCKYNNSEHDVIAEIIASLTPHGGRGYQTLGSPKMKLRYIKLLYPEVDETVLFDLLYNCDHNAQEVIERIEKMGYKRKDPPVTRPSTLRDLDFSKISRPKTAPQLPRQPQFPPNADEKQKMFESLQAAFPKADRTIINMALECASFNEERARIFLNSMTPQDSEKYMPKDWSDYQSTMITLFTKATQTNAFIDAMSGTPITKRRSQAEKTLSVATCTAEDGIIVEEKKKPLAKGSDPSNRKGASFFNLIKSYIPWRGSDSKNRHGADPSNRKGPDSSTKSSSNFKAKGPDSKNRKGPSSLFRRKKTADKC